MENHSYAAATVDGLTRRITSLETENRAYASADQAIRAHNTKLRKTVSTGTDQNDRQAKNIRNQRGEIKDLEGRAEEQDAAIRGLRGKLQGREDQIANQARMLAGMEAENGRYCVTLKAKDEIITIMRADIKRLEDTLIKQAEHLVNPPVIFTPGDEPMTATEVLKRQQSLDPLTAGIIRSEALEAELYRVKWQLTHALAYGDGRRAHIDTLRFDRDRFRKAVKELEKDVQDDSLRIADLGHTLEGLRQTIVELRKMVDGLQSTIAGFRKGPWLGR